MATINGIDKTHDFRVRFSFAENDINHTLLNDWKAFMDDWDRYCEIAVDMYGPPGRKYTCRLTKEACEFWFLDEKDAMMFELRCG